MMNFSKRTINTTAVLLLMLSSAGVPALAAKVATPFSAKIGYFNLDLVKASYPEAAGSELLKNQAEAQLRADLDAANKQIASMQEAKKPAEEIQKAVRDNQLAINAKQQALAQLIQAQSAVAREKIMQAVNQVCRDKGLDLAVDGAGVLGGGKTVLDNGVDITEEIVRVLSPATASSGGAGGGTAKR